MPHLSELHGAATHLAVVAIPLYVIVLLCRRADLGGDALVRAEPWVVGGAVVGTVLAGATGLLVWGQAQTELRGNSFRIGTVHFWLGIAVTLIVFGVAAWRFRRVKQDRHTHGHALLAGGLLALVAVLAQGYLGGRMTYHHGVGVDAGGQFAQTADGVRKLDVALAKGMRPPRRAGRRSRAAGSAARAVTATRPRAYAARAWRAAPSSRSSATSTAPACSRRTAVTDRDFAAINAWLRTLQRRGRG